MLCVRVDSGTAAGMPTAYHVYSTCAMVAWRGYASPISADQCPHSPVSKVMTHRGNCLAAESPGVFFVFFWGGGGGNIFFKVYGSKKNKCI